MRISQVWTVSIESDHTNGPNLLQSHIKAIKSNKASDRDGREVLFATYSCVSAANISHHELSLHER